MVFTSSDFPYFSKTLQNKFFTRTTSNACFSISLCYYLSFFHIKILCTSNIFDKSCIYSYTLHKLFFIVHLSWNVFLKVSGHSKCFFHSWGKVFPRVWNVFQFTWLGNFWDFFFEARSNCKFILESNALLSTAVTTMIIIVIVDQCKGNE